MGKSRAAPAWSGCDDVVEAVLALVMQVPTSAPALAARSLSVVGALAPWLKTHPAHVKPPRRAVLPPSFFGN